MNKLRLFLCTLLIATILFSCTKDDDPGNQKFTSTSVLPILPNYNWSVEEKDFFSLDNKLSLTSLRDDKSIDINPQILEAYSYVAEENERDNFATQILENVGYPLWVRGYTFTSRPSGEVKLTVIPLVKAQATNINGVLTIYEDASGKVLNGITRLEVLSNLTKKSKPKHGYLKYLNKQEEILFDEASIEIRTALCDIQQIIINNEYEAYSSEELTAGVDCFYEWKELCIDKENGYSWFNGVETIPVEFDHDQDGIVNAEDQDWRDLEDRYGITQVEFEESVREYWVTYYQDDYGDYEDFYDNFHHPIDGEDFYDFLDRLGDFFSGLGAWLQSDFQYDDDGVFDDLYYYDPFDDINCYYPPLKDDDVIDTRDIECNYFYIWNCELNSTPWWIFVHGFESTNNLLFDRLNDYYEANNLSGEVNYTYLQTIVQNASCDPWSTDFEHCVSHTYKNHRKAKLQEILDNLSHPVNVDIDYFYNATIDCYLNGQESFNGCVEQKVRDFWDKIDVFVQQNDLVYEDEIVSIYDVISFECNYAENFSDCAFGSIEDWWLEFLTQVYPEFQIPSHSKSFPFTKINDAYYCQTNFFNLGFWHEFNPTNWVAFCIPDLCIQVPVQNSSGPFNIHDLPRNVATACDKARSNILIEVLSNDVTTGAEGRSAFIAEFRKQISKILDISQSNVTLIQSNCNNGASVADYGVNIFSAKAASGECVYD